MQDKAIKKIVEETVKSISDGLVADVKRQLSELDEFIGLKDKITKLKEKIEELRIEKGRKEEEFEKREREIEHKVGLERQRQEFEIDQAKREATVSVQEDALDADKKRFKDEMKFQQERFVEEVKYQRSLLEKMLKRLPSAEIIASLGGHKPTEKEED